MKLPRAERQERTSLGRDANGASFDGDRSNDNNEFGGMDDSDHGLDKEGEGPRAR